MGKIKDLMIDRMNEEKVINFIRDVFENIDDVQFLKDLGYSEDEIDDRIQDVHQFLDEFDV